MFISTSCRQAEEKKGKCFTKSKSENKIQIKVQIQHKGKLESTYDLINHLINEVPMGALKYGQPAKVMKKELESLIK